MKQNISALDTKYRPRWIAPLLRNLAKQSPVVVLTGARQVGKSTLLQNEEPFNSWPIITLDDLLIRERAAKDPKSLWAGKTQLIVDEVQRETAILSAIKIAVDQRATRFILTGSANLLLMHKVSESLAGRALYINLEPMTLGEQKILEPPDTLARLLDGSVPIETTAPEQDPLTHILRGFMPGLLSIEPQDAVVSFWESYVATYLERDLRQLSQIDLLPDFRRLMEAIALRCGQVLNQAEVSRDIKVSQASVSRYLNLLETTNLVHRVPAFSGNRTSRIVKSPKVYWFDSGLASFLAGHFDAASLQDSREVGSMFECAIFLHLRVLSQLMKPRSRIYYWRTIAGKEVDFVVEHGRKVIPIEVKLTRSPSYGDTEGIRFFLERHSRAKTGIVIHAGSEVKYLSDRIIAIPWTFFAGIDRLTAWLN